MKLAAPKEIREGERRVALTPETCKKLTQAGLEVAVQVGAGEGAYFRDEEYQAAGARIEPDEAELLDDAEIIIKVNAPQALPGGRHEVDLLRRKAILVGTLQPTRNLELVRRLVEREITAFSTDAIPRITRAQAMDTLSSMSSIAGYKAVLLAAHRLGKYFPMLSTAAGTVLPAKVLVIGAGVAGLQAIATARRLGAAVEAFDARPVVKEQVESLGAKFVSLAVPHEQAQDAGGYAKKMSEEFYRQEMELIAKHAAAADVIITTALIGGVTAPRLITREMVDRMRPGSLIVDLAAEAGGNCELTEPGRTVEHNRVTIHGPLDLVTGTAVHGSQLYARNVATFVLEFCKDGNFQVNLTDEIQKGAIISHEGRVLHAPTQRALEQAGR